ncbi:jg22714, partial [Pararge aegeria aegeria]
MEVVVNSQRVLANGSAADGYVFLYVFDKQNNLTLLDSSITLTPSTHFDVTVSVWAIDSSDEVKSLSLKSRKCFLPT